MSAIKGSVRSGQLITTYGVGALVALDDESFIIRGIDTWRQGEINLHEPRLQSLLGVAGFCTPPIAEDEHDKNVPVARFPIWHSCPACERLDQYGQLTDVTGDKCNACGAPLTPSRFIVGCARGHIDDFPYFAWVHADGWDDRRQHELTLSTTGNSASLRSIVVNCSCGASRDMDGAFDRGALRSVRNCRGKRPWLIDADEECGETPRTLQRGASNVWFAATESALSIPPWSDGVFKTVEKNWKVISAVPDDALEATIRGAGLDHESGYTVEDIATVIRNRIAGANAPEKPEDLRRQELQALRKGRHDDGSRPDFVCVDTPLSEFAEQWFDEARLVKRLREVRALCYFTRLSPPTPLTKPQHRAQLYRSSPGWLPAAEITGEGVFLKLNEGRLERWEQQPVMLERATDIDDRYRQGFKGTGRSPNRTITPRFLLVHTLAHVLINQWALDCGYPAASLRERIYLGDSTAALMIYTATSDSAGSLGGVIARAQPDNLDDSLRSAFANAAWCSSDPICIETMAAGVDSLNKAACHACILLPEVSCEERNVLLDRATLIGAPGHHGTGFADFELQS